MGDAASGLVELSRSSNARLAWVSILTVLTVADDGQAFCKPEEQSFMSVLASTYSECGGLQACKTSTILQRLTQG